MLSSHCRFSEMAIRLNYCTRTLSIRDIPNIIWHYGSFPGKVMLYIVRSHRRHSILFIVSREYRTQTSSLFLNYILLHASSSVLGFCSSGTTREQHQHNCNHRCTVRRRRNRELWVADNNLDYCLIKVFFARQISEASSLLATPVLQLLNSNQINNLPIKPYHVLCRIESRQKYGEFQTQPALPLHVPKN